MSLFVAVEAYVADFGHRHQRLQSIHHSQTCTQYRNDGKFASCNLLGCHLAYRCLDFNIFQRKVASDLVTHEKSDFFKKFTEIFGSGFFFAHDRQFVLDHGVVDNMQLTHNE